MKYIPLFVGVLLSIIVIIYYIYFPHQNLKTRCLWKGISSSCFVLLGASSLYYAPSKISIIMMVALILGMLGDVLLDLSQCYPKQKVLYFLGGLGAFLFGHIAYMICFTNHFQPYIEIPVSLIIALIMVFILQKLGCRFQEQRIPIIIYCLIILLMLYQTIKYVIYIQGIYGITILLGAILFTVSDLILAFLLFQKRDHKPSLTWANLSTYYAAQMILVMSMYLYV